MPKKANTGLCTKYHDICLPKCFITKQILNCIYIYITNAQLCNRVFQNAQKSKDLRGWLAKYVVIHN